MTLSITHAAVVVTADDGTSEVDSNEWNAAHTLTGTVSIAQGGTNATSLTSNALDYFDGTSIASMAGTSWDNTNRSLTLTGATVTTDKPIMALSQTWNGVAVTFDAFTIDVTNTNSASTSRLFQCNVGGTQQFAIGRAGQLYLASGSILNFGTGDVTITHSTDALTFAGMNGLTLTGNTVTTSSPLLDMAQTWNAGAAAFTGLKLNITDTASLASGTWFLDCQKGGTSSVGFYFKNGDGFAHLLFGGPTGLGITGNTSSAWIGTQGAYYLQVNSSGVDVGTRFGIGLFTNTADTLLYRQAAAVFGVHNSTLTSAAGFQVYNTSDVGSGAPTNYERAVIDFTTSANVATIGAQAGGTGTVRKVALVGAGILTTSSILPTTDPGVTGQLWNSAGTVKVST